MSIDNAALQDELLSQMLLASQIDNLHLSLALLLDMTGEGEIDLVLEQEGKSPKQKTAYIQKILDDLRSPELKKSLQTILDQGNLSFFNQREFTAFINSLQEASEQREIVKLTVAHDFKEKDVRKMAAVLEEKIGCPIAFDLEVDRSLIGGAVIQYGSYLTDYSLKTRLSKFREHWQKAVVEKSK